MIVYGIKNCDTVKKARRWLDEHHIDYRFHDFRQDGLNRAMMNNWLQSLDWETLLNKRGTTWRKLDDPRKNDLNQSAAIDLMLAHPTLIKRPVIETAKGCLVGFNEAVFADRFGK